jgi:threonine dehydrogenase-like Zn-dependent dehydrogenase
MATQTSLPKTHRALVQHVYASPLEVNDVPTPQPGPGNAIVRILAANIVSYMRDITNGKRKYPYPTPIVPGTNSIGRVVAVGADAVRLKEGQLVYIDGTIRGRDDPSAIFLSGITQGGSDAAAKLMAGEWRDSTYAEYAKMPLENCHVLDERRLCGPVEEGGLGYSIEQLAFISQPLVPYGGLKSIGLQAGETIIVAPATGSFGGGAVLAALAMGAKVIAMGRNAAALAALTKLGPRVETVQIVNDYEKEITELKKFGTINAFFDISPPEAQNSTHFKSAILSLAPEGRVSLMGGLLNDLPIPHRFIMRNNITVKGKWMYYREDIPALINMVELGLLKLDLVKVVGKFPLQEWEKGYDAAAENTGVGEIAVITP